MAMKEEGNDGGNETAREGMCSEDEKDLIKLGCLFTFSKNAHCSLQMRQHFLPFETCLNPEICCDNSGACVYVGACLHVCVRERVRLCMRVRAYGVHLRSKTLIISSRFKQNLMPVVNSKRASPTKRERAFRASVCR